MWKRFAIVTLCFWVVACSGDDADPPDMQPDAASAAPDAGLPGPDAGDGEMPPDAAPPDAAPIPDGGPTGPTIESVETSDGYTEVRQGSAVELVITGARLAGVTSVRVGELEADQINASPAEVRARLRVPHAIAPAAHDVTASGGEGAATRNDAIALTPYVISPTALPEGHGTFQSPMTLCDGRVADSETGDTILLLAGEHACDGYVSLDGGQIVQGQGAAKTVVRRRGAFGFGGFRINSSARGSMTTFRDLAIEARFTGVDAIRDSGDGVLVVERVAMTRAGLRVTCFFGSGCPERVSVLSSTFVNAGIEIGGDEIPTEVDVSDSSFRLYPVGIRIETGRLRVQRTTFDLGTTAIALEGTRPSAVTVEVADSSFTDNTIAITLEGAATAAVEDSTFADNTTAVAVRAGTLRMRNTRIVGDEANPRQNGRGIHIVSGEVSMTGVTISGQTRSGVEVEAFSEPPVDEPVAVNLTDVLIEGGEYGVLLRGAPPAASLVMRSTTVLDQTVAAVSSGFRGISGNNDLRGNNRLSVVSGVALEDARTDPAVRFPIRAVGIALNDRSFTGTAFGPVELLPHYRIVDDRGAIRFEDPVPP